MKNALFSILFIFLTGNLCHLGLPWWTIVPFSALAVFWFPMKAGTAWFSGFLGGFLLWFINALWLSNANQGMLAGKVGELFMGLSSVQLMLVTGVLGGLLGGFAALTQTFARRPIVIPKQNPHST